jgi:hypothetical protein
VLLTSPASEESRSIFRTNRVPPEHCRVSQQCPADDPGQIRSGELLDEFTFSLTDRNLIELCLMLNLPYPRNAEPAPSSPFLTNRKIAGDLCPALTSNQTPNTNSGRRQFSSELRR